MKPYLMLSADEQVAQRRAGVGEDVHFPESLVAAVLAEYTSPGDLVLDPFAGFGTTLVVAERMGRRAIGVEVLASRVELIRHRVREPRVVNGDARRLADLVDGPVDLCLTSPPFMTATGHPENPLTGYRTRDGDYGTYLTEMGSVVAQVAALLRPGGHLVLNVANISRRDTVTPLAWDVAREAARHLRFVQETFLCWDRQPAGITGDYCMVLRKPGGTADEFRRPVRSARP